MTTGLPNDLQDFTNLHLFTWFCVFRCCSGVTNVHIMQEFLAHSLTSRLQFFLAIKPRQK